MKKMVNKHIDWINETLDKVDKKLKVIALKTFDIIPYTTKNGRHVPWYTNLNTTDIPDFSWWTNGFWGGLMWLMYNETGDNVYKECAIKQEELLDNAFNEFDDLHHDVGFMWHILSGASYKLTQNRKSRTRNLIAASVLSSRYNLKGGYIRAWNSTEAKYWTIIDTMMNIPLLYWASEETGDDRFAQIASSHADMAMRCHVRPDGSVAHIVSHNIESGEITEVDGQGYAPGSSWSRGQTWAIYGYALAYRYTGKKEYIDTAKKVANYFIACVCDDYLPRVDFRSPAEPVYRDATASCIAACGLIELATHVDEFEKRVYIDAAVRLLKAADKNYCDYSENEDALVLHGSHSYHVKEQMDMPIVYGDFYFVEALLKLKGNNFHIW